MGLLRKGICTCLLAICLLPGLAVKAEAAETATPYIQRMIQYYQYHQENALEQIDVLLDHISSIDSGQGMLWREIMGKWREFNTMALNYQELPEGLPEDDSLCIVVLGYALNADGSMTPELVARLETALRSAQKYPNAFIAVTGGGTAANAATTEAREMASWLHQNGISPDRIILEERSLSTTENAIHTYRLLAKGYPSVTSLAVITSQYHMVRGCALFQTMSSCAAAKGGRRMDVIASAVNATAKTHESMSYLARGISAIAGIPYVKTTVPAL